MCGAIPMDTRLTDPRKVDCSMWPAILFSPRMPSLDSTIRIVESNEGILGENRIAGHILQSTFLGSVNRVSIGIAPHIVWRVYVRNANLRCHLVPGLKVGLAWQISDASL